MLTPKQKEVLDFIETFRAAHGYAPSQQEIAKHFGFKSLGTVQNYLVRLERQGVLRKTWNARRGTQVVSGRRPDARYSDTEAYHSQPLKTPYAQAVPVPLVGLVAAGRPIEAITNDDALEVPAAMLTSGREHFVLKVVGDSMIEDGILEGDYVVIQKQETAHNGQTVVALINNEATIKRYQRRADRVELHPANPKYEPIIVKADESFRIEGVLAGVLRLMK